MRNKNILEKSFFVIFLQKACRDIIHKSDYLGQIKRIKHILQGDNTVVKALACRSINIYSKALGFAMFIQIKKLNKTLYLPYNL